MRLLIAGGGTGGHLYPGIAVARELMSRDPNAQITFVGTAQGIEARVLPREGLTLDLIRSAGLKGKSLATTSVLAGLTCRVRSPALTAGLSWPLVRLSTPAWK